jgi:hypothetical protein
MRFPKIAPLSVGSGYGEVYWHFMYYLAIAGKNKLCPNIKANKKECEIQSHTKCVGRFLFLVSHAVQVCWCIAVAYPLKVHCSPLVCWFHLLYHFWHKIVLAITCFLCTSHSNPSRLQLYPGRVLASTLDVYANGAIVNWTQPALKTAEN